MEVSKTIEYLSTDIAYQQVIDDVNSVLDQFQMSMEEKQPFVLVVSESFTNAVIHGNKKNPEKKVILRITVNEKVMSADIVDEGQGGLDYIRQRKPSKPFDEGGRGIDLIEHYATSVGYVQSPTGGMKVEIKFARIDKPVVD